LKAIVGIEIVIDKLEGKWKASQNRAADDRARIAQGLAIQEDDVEMAALMRADP
jgi:transcriptional regulator